MSGTNTRPVVGFVGLGSQGAPMAMQIVRAGFPTLVWARRPEATASFTAAGAEAAASVAELAARSEHVGVCVVDDAGVVEICEKLLDAMRPGGRIAIHSTIHPNTCADLAARAAARGIALIDAPVSGGGPAAETKKLAVMIGGDAAAVEAARPVFETFAGLIVHLGGVGAGQKAKLVNNAMMAAHMALAHHGLNAGAALGLDRAALTELIKQGSGRSFGFEVYARLPSPEAFSHGARLLAKDVRLLGEALGDNADGAVLSDLARRFLALALKGNAK